MDTSQNTGKKRTTLIVALVACLVLAVGAGVFAWFSAQDTKTNTFVSGTGITDPDVKPDPDRPTDPHPDPDNNPNTDGKIVETEWNENSPLAPGSITPKNPNMGIGGDSMPAYVFAMVENTLPADAYFVLGKGWKPVEGYVTEYKTTITVAPDQTVIDKHPSITDPDAKLYKSGLFVYVGETSDWAMLAPTVDPAGNKANYTGELFDKVYTSSTFDKNQVTGDKNTIKVSAYFAAASGDGEYTDENKNQLKEESKKEILASVKAWAANVKA